MILMSCLGLITHVPGRAQTFLTHRGSPVHGALDSRNSCTRQYIHEIRTFLWALFGHTSNHNLLYIFPLDAILGLTQTKAVGIQNVRVSVG